MSVFANMFGSKPAQQAPAQQQQAPQQQQTQVQDPSKQATQDGKMPGTDQQPVNPLDAYKDLFNNTQQQANQPPSFSLDPKVLGDAASKLNFTQGVNPELLSKATSGDMNSLLEIINHVGRQSYQAAMSHGSHLTNQFVGARSSFDMGQIGGQVKSELASSQLATSVPNASHPVVKQELTRIAKQLQSQNPDAHPNEIAEAAKQYFNALHGAMNQAPQQDPAKPTSGEVDWDKWF